MRFPEGGNITPSSEMFYEIGQIAANAGLYATNADALNSMQDYIRHNLPILAGVISWWDGLNGVGSITPLGIAVGYSNAKGFDAFPGFPSLSDMLTMD